MTDALVDPLDRLIVAVDAPDAAGRDALLGALEGTVRWVKIGSMAFNASGPAAVTDALRRGFQVFLDLKLHDIPHQVGETVRVLGGLGATLATVHASGGTEMLEAGVRACEGSALRLLAVTVLTSLDDEALGAVGSPGPAEALVLRRARLAVDAGVPGLVASAREAGTLRAALGAKPELVTPGIRPAGAALGDQRRVATPADALRDGATRLVVGRPITRAVDPALAAEGVLAEMRGAVAPV